MGYVIIGVLAAGIGVLAVVLCVRIKEYVKVKKRIPESHERIFRGE